MGLLCIWILIGLTEVYGKSSGPPASTCSSMTPSHGTSNAASSLSPYAISFSKSTYSENEEIQVTLQGSQDFKGFFIQPRSSKDGTTTFGSITTPSGSQNPCTGGTVALSHTSASSKSSVTFTWTAPARDEGAILFVYTVVQSFPTFWVKEVSSPITYQAAGTTNSTGGNSPTTTQGPTQAPTTTTGTPENTAVLKKNSGCGSEVGCFHDCEDDVCGFQFSWKDNGGDSVDFTVSCLGTGNHYCAVGLSTDDKMGDDSVVACVSDSGTVSVKHFYNTESKGNEPLDNDTFGLTLTSSSHVNGIISCTFQRKKTAALAASSSARKKRAVSDSSTFFNLNDDWIILYADGAYFTGFLAKHTTAPKVSCKKADFQGVADLAVCSPTLIYLHATFMMFAWMFFASFGIVTARYYKQVSPMDKEMCGEKRWFNIHRFSMILVLLCNVVGFILVFVYVEGYSKISGSAFKKSHPVIGIIVMVLTLLNPIMALLRPKPGTKFRPVFYVAHLCVGEGAYIFAILNVFSGTFFATTNVPSYIRIILIAYVVWVILVEVALFLYDRCTVKAANKGQRNASRVDDFPPTSQDRNKNEYELHARAGSNNGVSQKDGIHWKTIGLIFHVTALLGFTLATVIIIWTARDN